jgi:hypothetical protein
MSKPTAVGLRLGTVALAMALATTCPAPTLAAAPAAFEGDLQASSWVSPDGQTHTFGDLLVLRLQAGRASVARGCLPDGAGTYTAGTSGTWRFEAGNLAGSTCPASSRTDLTQLVTLLSRATAWVWSAGFAGAQQLRLTGPEGEISLTRPFGAGGPAYPAAAGSGQDTAALVGQWRAERIDVVGQGAASPVGTGAGPFTWTMTVAATSVKLPDPCGESPLTEFGLAADALGHWAVPSPAVPAQVVCAARLDATSPEVGTAVAEATVWTMPSPTTLILTGPRYRLELTKLPLCRAPGRALAVTRAPTVTAELVRASLKRGAKPKVSICLRVAGAAVPTGRVDITYALNGGKTKTKRLTLKAADAGRLAFTIPTKIARQDGSVAVSVAFRPTGQTKSVKAQARYVPKLSAGFVSSTAKVGARPVVKASLRGAGVALVSGKVTVRLRSYQTGQTVATASARIAHPARSTAVLVRLPAVKKAGTYLAEVLYGGNGQVASVLLRGEYGSPAAQTLRVTG